MKALRAAAEAKQNAEKLAAEAAALRAEARQYEAQTLLPRRIPVAELMCMKAVSASQIVAGRLEGKFDVGDVGAAAKSASATPRSGGWSGACLGLGLGTA